jgi:hypothetical protein
LIAWGKQQRFRVYDPSGNSSNRIPKEDNVLRSAIIFLIAQHYNRFSNFSGFNRLEIAAKIYRLLE